MARLGRYFAPDQVLHVIQRGNNKQAIFFKRDDYVRYAQWLGEAALRYGCAIHAYVLMTNHVHLLLTPAREDSLPGMMQSLGRRYVRHINDTRGRTGTLWEGRYRAAPIDSDDHFFSCCRYIELNPVRAKMVAHPREYRWSSYRAHALGEADALVSDHAMFKRLGRSAEERQQSYRALFRGKLDEGFVDELRAATNGGWVLGDERFKRRIAKETGRRTAPLPKGRPAKSVKDKRQLDLL
jgi:putative transposase